METCLRGFSFVPENKVEVMDLQYVEGGELSRAWKATRRQRMKDLETKIWDQFVKEQDIVHSVCSDDPYQFLERLPADCLNELMEVELNKMKEGNPGQIEEQAQIVVVPQETKKEYDETRDTMVTFADDLDPEQCEMIHIFDDEREDDASGPEQEATNESISPPCTVREHGGSSREPGGSSREPGGSSPEPQPDPDPDDPANPAGDANDKEKQSESVRDMIETSIYSAKVKELQSKINLELLAVITTLEAQDLNKIEPRDLPKFQRQCTEFCARFNRIYLYQLKRQVQDITRYNNSAPPFARHTFLRSQMIRAVSLQQNLLQALQVFHKWFTQKPPLRECVDSLNTFSQLIREGDLVCPVELHNDELQQTCNNMDGVLTLYMQRLNSFLNADNATTSRSKKAIGKQAPKKRTNGKWPKQAPKLNAEADARLSMYSLETLRVTSRASTNKDNASGGTSKVRLGEQSASNTKVAESVDATQKKKTPRSRRPLMRAPGGQRQREKNREPDNIRTMVEAVGMCASSHMSREASPRASPEGSPHRSKNATPRGARKPRAAPRAPSPGAAAERAARADAPSPVIRVQCERRGRADAAPAPAPSAPDSPKERCKDENAAASCDVSRLLRKLCAGGNSPGSKSDRPSGAKNAQLLCVNGGSPRQPSTPQLLRILEETIQKKAPKPQFYAKPKVKDADRYRLTFTVAPHAADALFQYRTKFVQHMLSSPMYANSAVGKPWEMIGSVSEQIIDEILLACAKEMQLEGFIEELYKTETQ